MIIHVVFVVSSVLLALSGDAKPTAGAAASPEKSGVAEAPAKGKA